MQEVKIIESTHVDNFIIEVNNHLASGWKIKGHLCVTEEGKFILLTRKLKKITQVLIKTSAEK